MESTKVSKISRAYGKTINLMNSLGIVPYKWCELHRRLEYQPFKTYWVVLVGFLAALHEIFFVWQAIRGFSNRHSIDLVTLTRKFFLAFCYIICNHDFLAVLKDPPFHAALVSEMIRTANCYPDGRPKEKRGNGRSLIALFWILEHVALEILPITLVLPVFWNPRNSFLYSSLLENPAGYGLISRAAIFVIQTYATVIHFAMLVYNCMTTAMCLFFITDMLRIAGSNVREKSKNRGNKIRFVKFNMELSVLVNCFNQIFREWMSAIELSLAVAVTVNTTVAVLTGMPRPLLTAAAIFMALFSTISMSGNTSTLSAQILESDWANGERISRHSWFDKSRRAIRPLRIEFGRFFYADKCLILTVLSAVLENTVNLLVVLRNP